ncbi:MAG: hypothetical protein ACKVOH_04520, partial [Chlamydiales bacterium]
MSKILFQSSATESQVEALQSEFPRYEMLTTCKDESDWFGVEIFYGHELSEQQLEIAPHLRWIHCPTADIDELCCKKIRERGNIIITIGFKKNIAHAGEFVIGALLAFSKQFF